MRRSSKPANTSSAVRQQKAPASVATDDPQTALYRALNFFPTPPWAARAGAEILLQLDPEARSVWEPACGQGHMVHGLLDYFPAVLGTDIHDHAGFTVHDFLLQPSIIQADWIVTNPPFNRAEEFLQHGLRHARRGVALLCRIAFLESGPRYKVLYEGPNRLTQCAVFCERVPMVLGQWDPDGSSAACYAWFFFHKGAPALPVIGIPPGTRDRLHRADDVRRFAQKSSAPLFDALA
jgi:hypothetical protein